MKAMFVRGLDPKDAMGIGDVKSRLANSLKELCDQLGYEFRLNKRGTPRMVVPVSYPLDTYGTYNASQRWKNGVVTEVHYTLTYMDDWVETPISLRKVICGYNAETGPAKVKDIKQSLMGRFTTFPEVIAPIKMSLKKEKKKTGDITTIKTIKDQYGRYC